MNWLDKLERRFGRFAISDLMLYVCCGMGAVFVYDLIQSGISLTALMALDRAAILNGQVWRLVTFIFAPPSSQLLFMFIAIYFYLFLGRSLESYWGSFRFTAYYLCGMLGCIAAATLTGYGTNTYLNLSLFLAFAALYPDMEILLFFILPIKVKYIAYVDWVLFGLTILFENNINRAAAIFSLLNFFLFFGADFIRRIRERQRYRNMRKNFWNQYNDNPWR